MDVVLLLDDPRPAASSDSKESFLFVSEAVTAIEAALLRLGHRPRRLSFALGVQAVVATLLTEAPDLVFQLGQPDPTDPAGEVQVTALLDLMGLAHTSESPAALVLASDKVRAKALFAQHGIPSPPYAVALDGELPAELPEGPWIAKPSLEDGSVGISCTHATQERAVLAERVTQLWRRFGQSILIETFMHGREFQVGIVGAELLPPVEIDFSQLPADLPRMTGYASKWHYTSPEFKGTHYVCPAQLDAELAARLTDVARKTAAAFRLRRCSRLDLRMDDAGGLYVLDVNPNPDLSPVATFPKMADAAGFGYDGLIARLVELGRAPRRSGASV